MTWTFGTALRLALIGILGGTLQLTTVSQLEIFGVGIDVSPLLVCTVGLLGGPIAGACFGFCLGVFEDTALLHTLGVSSLILTIVGYAAGRWRSLRDPYSISMVVMLGAVSTTIFVFGLAIVQFLLGVEAPLSLTVLRQMFLLIMINTMLAPPLFKLIRLIMRPCLIDDGRNRRRRIPVATRGPRSRARVR